MMTAAVALRWLGTLVLAWLVLRGHHWPIIAFMVLQGLGNEALGWTLRKHARELDDADRAMHRLSRRIEQVLLLQEELRR
jgi:hypothetical protein